MTSRITWTFQLVGGESISVRTPFSTLRHDGKASIWTLLLTLKEAEETEQILVGKGIRVTRWGSEDLPEKRGGSDVAWFATPRCPGCFWVDAATICNVVAWPREMVEEALSTYDVAKRDLVACPLRQPPVD